MNRPMLWSVAALAASMLAGCAGNVTLRHSLTWQDERTPEEKPVATYCPTVDHGVVSDASPGCGEAALERGKPMLPAEPNAYTLAIVELDDQGRFRKDRQLDAFEALLRQEAARAQRGETGGVSILVFVHGWRHNA